MAVQGVVLDYLLTPQRLKMCYYFHQSPPKDFEDQPSSKGPMP